MKCPAGQCGGGGGGLWTLMPCEMCLVREVGFAQEVKRLDF